LNTLLLNMEKMLSRLIGEDIDLVTVLTADPGTIRTDPGQLEQVIMNIVVNARDAMPGGGKLVIETSNVHVDSAYDAPALDLKSGDYVALAITDTGMGMDAETTAHLFEPFFTTKAPGKGTGLGLATAYGIVKQGGGSIAIDSEPGRGTTAKIYLPSAEFKEVADVTQAPALTSLMGTETILVLEDEPRVRKLICEVLLGRGYHVLEAVRGEEAIRKATDFGGTIHLLLTDVVMPEMSGPQAVEQIRAVYPAIKVLYVSGYTDEAILHHGIQATDQAFLQKPFLPDTLARKVREVLNSFASAG
jgi:CheY-like chemotaxis protein